MKNEEKLKEETIFKLYAEYIGGLDYYNFELCKDNASEKIYIAQMDHDGRLDLEVYTQDEFLDLIEERSTIREAVPPM